MTMTMRMTFRIGISACSLRCPSHPSQDDEPCVQEALSHNYLTRGREISLTTPRDASSRVCRCPILKLPFLISKQIGTPSYNYKNTLSVKKRGLKQLCSLVLILLLLVYE